MTMIEWRRVVQEYPCMTCGAPPGSKCVTTSGRYSYTPHQFRSHVASAHHWRSPEDDVEPPVGRVGHSPQVYEESPPLIHSEASAYDPSQE